MSYVDNFILTFSILDKDIRPVEQINEALSKSKRSWLPQLFQEVEYTAGYKCLEQPIFVAAFNYTDWEVLISAIISVDWTEPDTVRLWICGQQDDMFTQKNLAELDRMLREEAGYS